jgi:hypothetical protein
MENKETKKNDKRMKGVTKINNELIRRKINILKQSFVFCIRRPSDTT